MRVLVTGGTGYLGQAVVRALVSAGHSAVVFSRRPPDDTPSSPRIRHVRGDVRSLDDLRTTVPGCDAICHVAALVSIRKSPAEFDAVNVGGLRNVLAAAREAGIERVVHTSSFLAHPPAGTPGVLGANDYQRTKAEALRVARVAMGDGARLIVVTPGVIYGPGPASEGNLVGRLLRDHLRGRLPGLVGAGRTWSFSFVEDVARGHVLALEHGAHGTEYGLGGPNLPQVAPFEWLKARTGLPLPRRLPFALASAVGVVEEVRSALTGSVPLATRGAVEIFKYDWPVDCGSSVRDLGYAITPLEVGLEATVAPWLSATAPEARA